MAIRKKHNVYVVELDHKVWSDSWKFRKANPQYRGNKQCLYVGMTGLCPKARFMKHKTGALSKKGHKIASWYVEKYGKFLRPSLYHALNPMSYDEAKEMEAALAASLRRKGYAVWWN